MRFVHIFISLVSIVTSGEILGDDYEEDYDDLEDYDDDYDGDIENLDYDTLKEIEETLSRYV